jgi:hypothetical protein
MSSGGGGEKELLVLCVYHCLSVNLQIITMSSSTRETVRAVKNERPRLCPTTKLVMIVMMNASKIACSLFIFSLCESNFIKVSFLCSLVKGCFSSLFLLSYA